MAAAILNGGKTAIRNALKTLITHNGFYSDNTAFSATQTQGNPSGAGTVLVKPTTHTDVDAFTFDSQSTINGDTEFTNGTIFTITVQNGSANTNALSRSVRSQGIGVQAGDLFTVGSRVQVQDNS